MRGYSRSLLGTCLKSFKQRKERDNNKKIIPLITTFSSHNNHINYVIKSNFEKFTQQSGLLPNHKIISAYRKKKNLSDFLVRAKLPSPPLNRTERHPDYFCNIDYIRNQKDGTFTFRGDSLPERPTAYMSFFVQNVENNILSS